MKTTINNKQSGKRQLNFDLKTMTGWEQRIVSICNTVNTKERNALIISLNRDLKQRDNKIKGIEKRIAESERRESKLKKQYLMQS